MTLKPVARLIVVGEDEVLAARIASAAVPSVGTVLTAEDDAAALALSTPERPTVLAVILGSVPVDAERRIARIHEELPEVPIVGVTERNVLALGGLIKRLLRSGVMGLVVADELETALAPALELAALGVLSMPGELQESLARPALSHREKEILMLVAEGFTNSQIAQRLYLSESTVKSHLTASFRKLAVTTRAQAAKRALEQAN